MTQTENHSQPGAQPRPGDDSPPASLRGNLRARQRNHDQPPNLIDLINASTLQRMQDGFVDVTGLRVLIRDADGQPLTRPTNLDRRRQTDALLAELVEAGDVAHDASAAPVIVDGQRLGSITIETGADDDGEAGADAPQPPATPVQDAASIQFLQLLAHGINRMCAAEHHLMQRVDELTALYRLSGALARHDDLQQILDSAAREAAGVLSIKAVSIRLYEEESNQFIPRAVHNLSETYLNLSPIFRGNAEIFTRAFNGETVTINDLHATPLAHDPDAAEREGINSMICTGLIYRDVGVGVIQLFTEQPHDFDWFEINLIKTMARLLAAAIESHRLEYERSARRQMQRQLKLAADVQRRMLPGAMPQVPGLDLAARYVPSLQLGGDFYDLVDLEGHLGIVIGDVVGKGVAAALLMASVRASLRAYAQDLYDIDEILLRVNSALVRDTRDAEFATLFYGVIDPATRRLTYCNAGHDPPLLWRDGRVQQLDVGGMIVGVDPEAQYNKAIIDLEPGDALMLYTDGLIDAMNFNQQRFGRERTEKAFTEAAQLNDADTGLHHVLWECRRYTGLQPATDDTTIVMVKVDDGDEV